MKSLMTIASMTLDETLKDKNQGYDIIDSWQILKILNPVVDEL
jgi:hypothetical protein